MTQIDPPAGDGVTPKPCPFCGGTNLRSGGDDKVVGTWCLTCEAAGPNEYGKFSWDHRPAADRPVPEVAATYRAFTDGMQAAAEICGSLASSYDGANAFDVAADCEAQIMKVVREQRAEQGSRPEERSEWIGLIEKVLGPIREADRPVPAGMGEIKRVLKDETSLAKVMAQDAGMSWSSLVPAGSEGIAQADRCGLGTQVFWIARARSALSSLRSQEEPE